MKRVRRKIRCHFLPNTHLDREWVMDFQHSRELTVEFLDALMDILKKIPEYHFLLDSQTVPLEDYLEIRPEKEILVKKFVREGRLNVGPWYTAPDMSCISGESVLRNLLVGHKTAKEYGQVMKIGYTPFGFVHISQLPQIYKGFGIDVCYLYRAIDSRVVPGGEFRWESPDGTVLLSSRLSVFYPRANFYTGVWRPTFFKGLEYRLNRFYDWRDGQAPFKFCAEEDRFDQGYLLKPYRKFDEEALRDSLRKLIEVEKNTFQTSEITFMHGFDTSMPDIREDEILKKSQKYLQKGESFFYSSLPYYTKCLKKAIKNVPLKNLKGEMMAPGWVIGPHLKMTFVNIASARIKQKMLTAKAENILERMTEPFATIAYMLGAEWPEKYLQHAWKYFLKCHSHDTIAGCSVDQVEEDATYRLNQVISLSKVVLKESLGKIQININNSDISKENILLTVFNPSPFERTEIAESYVDIPRELDIKKFILLDDKNERVDFIQTATGNIGKIFRDKTDLGLFCTTDEYKINFLTRDIPAMGYRTYVIRKGAPSRNEEKISRKSNLMENENLVVKINDNGTINIKNKTTGLQYRGLHYFEDSGEAGHAWTYIPPEKDKTITSRKTKAKISLIEDNNLLTRYEVHVRMMIPETTLYDVELRNTDLGPKGARRSRSKKTVDIRSHFTLRKGAESLEVQTRVMNTCRNHRLRLMFPTRLKAKFSYAETPFDVVQRIIDRDRNHPYSGAQNPNYPFLKFVGLCDEKNGLSFIGNGLREYEAQDNKDRTLAITLIRATEIRLATASFSAMDKAPGDLSQSLGENVFNYYIYPHRGDWQSSDVFKEAERLNFPLIVCETGAKKGGKLPKRFGFLKIDGDSLILSALKKSDYNDSIIIRVFNPTRKTASGKITLFKKIESANFVNMNEEKIRNRKVKVKENVIELTVPHKKIVTLSLRF